MAVSKFFECMKIPIPEINEEMAIIGKANFKNNSLVLYSSGVILSHSCLGVKNKFRSLKIEFRMLFDLYDILN
ncbi:hypothetical protein GCQ56_11145 [Marinifilum sp. N1E240]|uniref:hypothetical protein n=1 Tax=Marinifilum sp. N1E240 TaxID=2608082 RepID=UPI00128C3970|nr:hypothetical protein [Marinifilum sp. N1E240]MPQ47557.1 hypothetical protein [Marinifilum sp. N1E240]